MLGLLIGYPWLAIIPGLGLLFLAARSRSRTAQLAGLAWLAYGAYEYGMKARLLCSGECNIRVDLLLIYPVLAGLSIVALVRAMRNRRR